MKKTQTIGVLILIATMTVSAQSQSEKHESSEKTNDWKFLTEEKYEINYPENWDVDTSGQMGTSFILFSHPTGAGDLFKENINLSIQDLTGHNLTLDGYVDLTENQVNTMAPNGKIILSERRNEGDSEHHKMVYTATQGGFDLKFEQYYWIINDEAFVLTLTCESSEFKNYQTIGEAILNSFKIKKK